MKTIHTLLLVLICSIVCTAQANPNLEQGMKPFGSYAGSNIDSVSLSNGNLRVEIPVWSSPQRGALPLKFVLLYNNKAFYVAQTCNPMTGDCTSHWKYRNSGNPAPSLVQVRPPSSSSKLIENLYYYTATDYDGATHQMGDASSHLESVDGTAIYWNGGNGASTLSITTDRSGLQDRYGPTQSATIQDPNGNQITYDANGNLIDSLGRVIPLGVATSDLSGCQGSLPITYASLQSFPGLNGGTFQVKLCSVSLALHTNFQERDANNTLIAEENTSANALQTAVFYNGSSWASSPAWVFEYNNGQNGTGIINYGDLTKITLPTGGTISYTYTNNTSCNSMNTVTTASRWVTSRTVDANDGTGPHTASYDYQGLGTIVTDAAQNDTVHIFTGLSFSCSLYETKTQYYAGTGGTRSLLRTVDTDYASMPSPLDSGADGGGSAINVHPIRRTTTLDNGKVTKTEWDYDNSETFSFLGTSYTVSFGTLLEERVYDYGNAAPGPLLRRTHYTYTSADYPAYATANLFDRIDSVVVYDGNGVQVASTTYNYDQIALQGSGITTQRDTSVGGVRGNQTSVHKWLNTTGGTLDWTSYYDTGMPYQVTDPAGRVTTYSYSGSFAGAYVTQTQMPDTNSPNLAHHVISGNYDFNTGLLTTFTDQNNQTTSYNYDLLGRMTSAVFPDTDASGNHGQTTFYYPDNNTVETKHRIDPSRWTDQYVLFDGLGRESRRQSFNDEISNPWDQVDTCYNAIGSKSFVSYPYQGAGYANNSKICIGTGDSFNYDALQRLKQLQHSDGSTVDYLYTGAATSVTDEGNGSYRVQRISQTNALGQLKSVCEISSGTLLGSSGTPANCQLDIAGTGFLTNYDYDGLGNLKAVHQAGLQDRTFSYDSLSRLLTASNPESGTTCYGQWVSAQCVNGYDAGGNLIYRTRPAPNQSNPNTTVTTTYSYDQLNRLTQKSYSDGTTHLATFHYDESTPQGVSVSNPIGRMTSEDVGLASSALSYDPMGRVISNWQCTPRTCGTSSYDLTYQYDLLGNILSSNNGVGVILTNSYNQAGRLAQVTSNANDATHPGVLLTNLHYGSFGLTKALYGNDVAESDSYFPRGWLQNRTIGGQPTPGIGSVTFSGNEQSAQVLTQAATAGTGNVSVNGAEQSTQVMIQGAIQAVGSVTISGSERRRQATDCPAHQICYDYDSGTVWISVNGVQASAFYAQGSTTSSIAVDLANAINGWGGSPATASASGATVYLYAAPAGTGGNGYSLTSGYTFDQTITSVPSFTTANSPFAGGADPVYQTVYDSGSITITVNGHPNSASFGQGSTNASVATALAGNINADGAASVTASASGNVVYLTSKVVGAGSNYSLSSSWSYDTGHFGGPSFTTSNSPGGSLSGGGDAVYSTVYDTGSATITVNGHANTVNWGQGWSPSVIASALTANINSDPAASVTAAYAGNTVYLDARTAGTTSNDSLSTSIGHTPTSNFPSSSFSSSASGSVLSGGNAGGAVLYSVGLTYFNDGNVNSANDTVNGNWAYSYDQFNRLLTSNKNSGVQAFSYDYDRYGNRLHQNVIAGSGPAPNYSFGGGNNRIDGYSYDAAGNLLNDGCHSYTYDAENRIITASPVGACTGSGTYVYDAEGRRVKRTGTENVEFLYDLAGHPVTQLDATNGNVNRDEVYAAGQHIVTYYSNTTFFDHADWLGTERARSNLSGALCQTNASLPFGDGASNPINTCNPTRDFFTGKERDSEDALDYFGARYYSNQMGRWMSPDWSASSETVPYADLTDPQTLNLYGYVRNNPMSHADADGHCPWCAVVEEIAESPEGQEAIDWGAHLLAGAGTLLGTAASALGGGPGFGGNMGTLGMTSSMVDAQRQIQQEQVLQSAAKNVPNPNGSKGAPDHQQTADEEAAAMGPNGQREVRVETPGGEKESRVIDSAKVENGKVTEARQVIRPNKNGTPPAREVRAARDIHKATGVKPKMVPVRPCTNNKGSCGK